MDLYDRVNYYKSAVQNCLTDAKYKELSKCILSDGEVTKPTAVYTINRENYRAKMVICCKNNNIANETKVVDDWLNACLFVPLQMGLATPSSTNHFNPWCNHDGQCRSAPAIQEDLERLSSLLKEITPEIEERKQAATLDKSMIGKGAAIGAAVGVGTAGLATAITAFVERENINCRVGDGLEQVGYGKTHTINSLKDFYTKWNLRLPDRIMPTTHIEDSVQLATACAQFNSRLTDCPDVQVIYDYYPDPKDKTAKKTTILSNACVVDTGACVPNSKVVKLYNLDAAKPYVLGSTTAITNKIKL
jgi:hypothetical protein